MSGAAYEDSDDVPVIPERDLTPAHSSTPGSASWAERLGDGPPPYEESAAQVEARMRARAEADLESVERRRKRRARVAVRREAAATRALARRYDEAGGA